MKISNSTYIQISVWIGLLAMPLLIFQSIEKPDGFYLFVATRVLTLMIYFNILYHLLLPMYFSGKKQAFYWYMPLTLVSLVLVFVMMNKLVQEPQFNASLHALPNSPDLVKFAFIPPVLMGLLVFGIAASMRAFEAYENKKKEEEEANRRRVKAELALLKSQINPHFLLNTLNNLYALALTAPEKTPDALLKLSDMVRYILYECQQPKIALQHDLQFIENYIALQRLRLPANVILDFNMPQPPISGEIEPMMLIPFIENAFKHGLTTKQPCKLLIAINLNGNRLELRVENDIVLQKNDNLHEKSGIGLANTRQRLESGYPKKHVLFENQTNGKYMVELTIYL